MRDIFDEYVKENGLINLFNLFQNKFKRKSPRDEFKIFVQIFNFFINYTCEHYASIEYKVSNEIYETIMRRNNVSVKNDLIEKFILKVVESYTDNFLIVENVLLMTGMQLNARMVEKVFEHFNKVKFFNLGQ